MRNLTKLPMLAGLVAMVALSLGMAGEAQADHWRGGGHAWGGGRGWGGGHSWGGGWGHGYVRGPVYQPYRWQPRRVYVPQAPVYYAPPAPVYAPPVYAPQQMYTPPVYAPQGY